MNPALATGVEYTVNVVPGIVEVNTETQKLKLTENSLQVMKIDMCGGTFTKMV